MKRDVTDLVQRYRQVLRHVWNYGIWSDPDLRDWDSVYSFRELKLPLFKTLVADALQAEASILFGSAFEVTADPEKSTCLDIQINRLPASDIDGAGVWEPFPSGAGPDAKLTLVDVMDWSPLGYIDLQYFIVLIEEFPLSPEKIGHHALVEANRTKIFWDEPHR